MDQKTVKMLARAVVDSMNMKEGQTLLVKSGSHVQELVEEISLLAMKNGIDTMIGTSSDIYSYRAIKETPVKYLKKPSKISMKLIGGLDNFISIEKMKDPRMMEGIEHKRFAASSEGGEPVSQKMKRLNVKWCYVGYPTHEIAEKLGISFSTLRKFIT